MTLLAFGVSSDRMPKPATIAVSPDEPIRFFFKNISYGTDACDGVL
jgi:hypothetical protein